MIDPLRGSSWSAPGTVAGFAQSQPNATLMQFAAAERERGARRALDLGCGAGRNAVPLASLGWTIVGLDLSGPMLGAAAARARAECPAGRMDLVMAPMEHLPLQSSSVDLGDRTRHLESGAIGGAVPRRDSRSGSGGQARRGTLRLHVLEDDVAGRTRARGWGALRLHGVLR